MPVTVTEWKGLRRGPLCGFAVVRLGGLKIHDVAVFSANGKTWAAMPTKPMVAGTTVLLDKANKPRRSPVVEWAERSAERRFSESVIAALLDHHPGALDDGGGGT